MKKIKNIIIFVAMLLIVVVYSAPVVAKAVFPSYDYGWAFSYSYTARNTTTETKNTSSSVKMECTSCDTENAYYIARVWGTNEDEGGGRDVSHNNDYLFEQGTTRYMLNWVYEEGYDKAYVRAIAYNVDMEYGTCIGGKWYPDWND